MENRVKSKLKTIYEKSSNISQELIDPYVSLTVESIWKFSEKDNYLFKQRALSILKALSDPKRYLLSKIENEGPRFLEILYSIPSVDLNPEAKQKKIDDARVEYDIPEYDKPGYRGMFQCSKCKSWKSSFTQSQRRSADEPMTTVVVFHCCNRVIKFS